MPQPANQLHSRPGVLQENEEGGCGPRLATQPVLRPLRDITNTCLAKRHKSSKPEWSGQHSKKGAVGSVGDMVTFWEQRASIPPLRSVQYQ